MFELTPEELTNWRSQFGTSNREKMGLRIPPFAFTEHGVLMLASVLNSERAVQVNIQVVRIFTKMREMLLSHKDVIETLRQIELKLADHDDKILLIFEYLKQLEQAKQHHEDQANRRLIGFKRNENEPSDPDV
jgi:phage regulator Rha-like protein